VSVSVRREPRGRERGGALACADSGLPERGGLVAAPEASPEEAPRAISEREYKQFQALIEHEAGIHLGPEKKALLVGRLRRRLVALQLKSFSDYYQLVTEGDVDERVRMLDAISTNETSFFREMRQFDFLRERVFPRWIEEEAAARRSRKIRAWSAACSTGEEPYSLAMVLLERFPRGAGWALEILASDISTRVLAQATVGAYPLERAREIPTAYLHRFMLRGTRSQQGRMCVAPALREIVTFQRLNLSAPAHAVQGTFDLIFCRNVLMYFEAGLRMRAVNALLDQLAPGGYLFLGHAESLSGLSERAKYVGPAIYAIEASAR
jgi:chemotaxis protein methyltransferase CheR